MYAYWWSHSADISISGVYTILLSTKARSVIWSSHAALIRVSSYFSLSISSKKMSHCQMNTLHKRKCKWIVKLKDPLNKVSVNLFYRAY